MFSDLKLAFLNLRKHPVSSGVIIVTLAGLIGAVFA